MASYRILCISLMVSASAAAATNGLSPSEELASFHLADPSLTVELIAAEPQVVSPVAMAFDADGRLFVAEMSDYPNGPMTGRIRMLQDRDGDGRYGSATVFADQLRFPNGVMPWNGGVLVTAAPDIWFLKDTDGDGRADERRVLFTGFGTGNQQLRVNGLTWGLDNWVYGANGRSDGEVRGGSLTKPVSLRGHDFRFRPGTGEFEAIAGRSQFGQTRDDWGNRFLSWNTIPVRHEVLPERYLARNPNLASTESVLDIIASGDTGRVFPLTPPPLTFNNESVKHFNALAGLTIYRGDALGEEYRGNAFMGESLLNLVHRRVLEPDGVTFVAKRAQGHPPLDEYDKEFLASTDPWFHAVNFANGPDGALYVVDFYRRFVEHPDFVHGKGRDEVPWRSGAEHGRIWRIKNRQIQIPGEKPTLTHATSAELVNHLRDDNGWWRDAAQRLLVERQDRSVIPALDSIVCSNMSSALLLRLHALYTLDGLGALTPTLLVTSLEDWDVRIREHAIRLSEPFVKSSNAWPFDLSERLRTAVLARSKDPDWRVRFQLALTLGEFDDTAKLPVLSQLARWDFSKPWHRLAILSSVGSRPWPFLKDFLQDSAWLRAYSYSGSSALNFLDQTATLVGASHSQRELSECLLLIGRSMTSSSNAALAVLAGLADGLRRSPPSFRQLLRDRPAALNNEIEELSKVLHVVLQAARPIVLPSQPIDHVDQSTPERRFAIRILARATPEISGEPLLGLLRPDEPKEIQTAAANALAELDDPDVTKRVFARWSEYAAGTRRHMLSALSGCVSGRNVIADLLEQGKLAPVELDASVRQSLLKRSDDQLKTRFKPFFENTSDRDEVMRRFEPALKLAGDRRHGAAVFAKTCLLCHVVEGQGSHVGPDLTAVASRPKEALLVDILDPSRQVSPDFINYTLTATDGKIVTGFIVSETATSVTLRRAAEADETVLRRNIKELRAEGKSLMPEGLEQGLSLQQIADLLSFLQKPEASLLPSPK